MVNLKAIISNIKRHLRAPLNFWYLRKEIRINNLDLKIVVGAGGICDKGWISTDKETLNLLKESDWERLFQENSISMILAEHVWEHLTEEEGSKAAHNCYRYLRTGGHLRIAVPDGFHPDSKYIDYVKVGGTGSGADDHKVLYNYKILTGLLEKVGFDVDLLEYFDENGEFYFKNWSPDHGKIYRSMRFDPRNINGKPSYTSLIVDARKK